MEGEVQSMDYVCQVCGKKFGSYKQLRLHSLSHTDKLLECEDCDKKFSRKCDLTRHCRTVHPEVGEDECGECGKKFFSKIMLHRHSLVHARRTRSNSSGFSENISWNGKASPHLLNRSEGGIFECGECGKMFTDRSPLDVHMMVHTGEKIFECNTCGKQFGAKSKLTRHELIHSGVKNYKCSVCGQRFARKDKLTMHLHTHHPEVEIFACSVGKCSYKFTHREQLDQHMTVHEKTCYVCGKTMKSKDKLNRHMIVHTGVKDYECEKCGKKFARKDKLNIHLMTHTEKKAFKPGKCSKKVTRNHSPRVLAGNTHVDMETFECGECGDTFLKKTQLFKHLEEHE